MPIQSLSLDQLALVAGGQMADGIAASKRAGDHKTGKGSLDMFGYSETDKQGVGAEIRQRISPNISVFGQGHVGTKNDKPDAGVMGGIRIEW
jgi:hypothetical protein